MRTSDIGQRAKQKNEGYVVGADMENIYDYFPDIKASRLATGREVAEPFGGRLHLAHRR